MDSKLSNDLDEGKRGGSFMLIVDISFNVTEQNLELTGGKFAALNISYHYSDCLSGGRG